MSPTASTDTTLDERFERLPIDAIGASTTNPRSHFDAHYLAELAGSIREKGVVQPILVRQVDAGSHKAKRFEIIAGECRYRASKLAEQTTIPAIIRSYTDEQVLELQLIENIHRKDLTPLEEARGYRSLIDANPTKHSADSIATRIGMSAAWVWDRLKLNDLVPEAKTILERGLMAIGHAILIARLKPADQQRAIDIDGDRNGYHSQSDGLWQFDDARLLDDAAEEKAAKKDKYHGLKAVSIRELESWIREHIRFDVAHAAKAVPLVFEPVAAAVATAAEQPGRGKKVIPITFSHRVADDARDENERTYGSESWERADGQGKSKTCEHSVLGVVVAGAEHYGETFTVCVARDKCLVHFGQVIREKAKNAKARESGKPGAAARQRQADERREQKERQQREQKDARWKVFRPALKQAVDAAAAKLPAVLPKAVFAHVLIAFNLPKGTTAAQLQKAMLDDAIKQTFRSQWYGEELRMVAWAKLLGVDVKACEPADDTKADAPAKAKKPAKKKAAA
jgi:ParB/RepB/Spo0J family partition protein